MMKRSYSLRLFAVGAWCGFIIGCAGGPLRPNEALGTTWIEANHTTLRYALSGSGPSTLVFLHEMQMTLESWDEIVPALQPGRRILRYDLRGFGLSEKIRRPISIEDEVQDLRALLDRLQVQRPVTLIGGAVGAAVALKFAVTSPAVYLKSQPELIGAVAGPADRSIRFSIERTVDVLYPKALRVDQARFERFRNIVLSTDPESFAATARMIYETGFAAVLPQVRCPTLVIATALFPRPVASIKELADLIPNSQFVVLETGHFASIESPELVTPVLRHFLRAHGI
jgi:3-oxoadipate enol-lactonase